MDHGGEAARPTAVESTDLHSSTVFARQVRSVPAAVFHRGMAYANIVVFWRRPGPIGVVLVGPQLLDGVMTVHDNDYSYSALHNRPGAGRGVVLADLLPGGAGVVYSLDYVLQPRPGAGHGDMLGDLFPLTDGAGHGELSVRIRLLPGVVDAVYDNYSYFPWQPRLGAGRGEVFIGQLPHGVGVVFFGSGNFAQRTLPGTVRANGIGGMLRDLNPGAEHDGSGTLADDLGAVNDDRGMAAEHQRRLLAFVGIGACTVAVNGLAASPGSPAVAFHLFVLLLAGLFLVVLHVLRV